MSTLPSTTASSQPAGPAVAPMPDPDLDRRWNAWKARGVAHERAAHRRFVGGAIVASVIALAALVIRALFA